VGLTQDLGLTTPRPNGLQRAVQRIGSTDLGTAVFSRLIGPLDKAVHRITKGRVTFSRSLAAFPVVMLTTIGARTGAARTVPVNVIPYGDDLALVASNFGRGKLPGWAHNLMANPDATVSVAGKSRSVEAQLVGADQAESVFAAAVRVYPGYARYRAKAASVIPVFILIPGGQT